MLLSLGLAAYGALFAFVGAKFKRPLMIGLIFIFGWEQAALAFPGYLKRFTVAYYLQGLVPHAMPNDGVISLVQGIFRESPSLVGRRPDVDPPGPSGGVSERQWKRHFVAMPLPWALPRTVGCRRQDRTTAKRRNVSQRTLASLDEAIGGESQAAVVQMSSPGASGAPARSSWWSSR